MTISGVKRPSGKLELTTNEQRWIEFLRLVSKDEDPPPTLLLVQGLRVLFRDPQILLRVADRQ